MTTNDQNFALTCHPKDAIESHFASYHADSWADKLMRRSSSFIYLSSSKSFRYLSQKKINK